MKRKSLLLFILALTLTLFIVSCGEKPPTLFIVEFETNTDDSIQSLAIENGKTLTEPTKPTKQGYTFLGWYNGGTLWNFDTDTVTSDITLVAKWQRIAYTVTFDTDGGGEIAPQIINQGDTASIPQNPTKKDSEFIGWYNGEALWNFDTDTVTSNVTLTAKWRYTITYDTDGGSTVNPAYVVSGNKISAPTPPTKNNSLFVGWYNGDVLWNFETDTVTSSITLKAKWDVAPTLTVTFDTDGGSEAAPQHIVHGNKATLPIQPTKINSRFIGWYNGEALWNFETDTVTSNITLKAKWESAKTFTVTFNTDGGSEVAPQYIVQGDKATLTVNRQKKIHTL